MCTSSGWNISGTAFPLKENKQVKLNRKGQTVSLENVPGVEEDGKVITEREG